MVKLIINETDNIRNGSKLPLNAFSDHPTVDIDWQHSNKEMYTLIILDETIRRVHLLISDIQGSNIATGNDVIPFEYTNPSSGSHTYSVNVFLQEDKISVGSVHRRNRRNFNMNSFARRNGLRLIDSLSFMVGTGGTQGTRREGTVRSPVRSPERSPKRSYHPRTTKETHHGHEGYFKPGSDLTPGQEKYCACTLHVAAKQSEKCLETKSWRQTIDGETCTNPYAVCAKSTGTSVGRSGKCGKSFNYENLPDLELRAYAYLHNIKIPRPFNRQTVLNSIYEWKSKEGH